jgi:hypothetical protein
MSDTNDEVMPVRGAAHRALEVFLGEWRAEGISYGGTDQSGADPKANGVSWVSTHAARWQTGNFFLIQQERASVGGLAFETLSVLGVEPSGTSHFARTFDNGGFYRHYALSVNGNVWLLEGETERARTIFDEQGDTQTITWEWFRNGRWLPLCDRVARRVKPAE